MQSRTRRLPRILMFPQSLHQHREVYVLAADGLVGVDGDGVGAFGEGFALFGGEEAHFVWGCR